MNKDLRLAPEENPYRREKGKYDYEEQPYEADAFDEGAKAQLTKALEIWEKDRLDRPEVEKEIRDVVWDYKCDEDNLLDTEWVVKQILAIKPTEEEIRKDERERIMAWRYEICPHDEAYEKRECDACWQTLKEGQ